MRSRFSAVVFLVLLALVCGCAGAPESAGPELRCKPDGTFKILLISDMHYTATPDTYSLALIERLMRLERPDLVIANGDNIAGIPGPTVEHLKQAIANVASVMEKRRTPWAITFGNHDQEHFAVTGMSKPEVLELYESYPYNVNRGWARGIYGGGNKNLLIWDSKGEKPVFAVWLIDSNDSPPKKEDRYDYIRKDQVDWYVQTSIDLETKYGRKIPGLMFMHIPLPEYRDMITYAKVIGERHEPECPSNVNGGMFDAILGRGDVKGVFAGHDHVNNYVGLWKGVMLGYDGVVGFRTYPHIPPNDVANRRARGGRAFLIREADPASFKTWMRFSDGTKNWESWSDNYWRVEIEGKR